MRTIHQNLKHYRERNGSTPKQIAMVLGIATEMYVKYEAGTAEITVVQLIRLCDYYELSIDNFISTEYLAPAPTLPIENIQVPNDQPKTRKVRTAPFIKASKIVDKARKAKRKTGGANPSKFPEALPGSYVPADPEKRLLDLITNVLVESTMLEIKDRTELEHSLEGYHYPHKKACLICGDVVSGEDSWYDKNGLKCMNCQQAIASGIIPYWLCKSKDSFYTEIQLELSFAMKAGNRKAFKKAGLLISRIIPKSDGSGTHVELFLRKDNREFLPPHKLIRIGGPVKETNSEGIEEYVLGYPWYFFVDPLEHLKDYGIAKFLRFTPVAGGTPSEAEPDNNE